MNCTANACTTADAGDDAGRFALTTTAPCCRVTEYGLMRVSGKDAVTFLHGQFTNAVTGLADEVRNAGYCTPKGRLLATFRVWMDGDDVMMLVPKAVAPAFFKRLRMYVLRADVTFTCTGGDVVMTGVPAGAEAFLEAAGLPVPASSRVVRHDGLVIVDAEPASKVEGFCAGGRRALIIAPKDDARFADASTDSALWWASEIAAGKTTVWPGSRELFVPQAVNYELSGGVVFNKGCYPGQEVVSRVQHIGETSRRAAFGLVAGTEAPLPGAPVYCDGAEAKSRPSSPSRLCAPPSRAASRSRPKARRSRSCRCPTRSRPQPDRTDPHSTGGRHPSVVTAAFSFMSLTLSPAQQTEHVMSAYTEGKMTNSTEPSSGSLQGGRAVP